MFTAFLGVFEYFDGVDKQKTQQNQCFAGLWLCLIGLFVTLSGFKPETF
jgi:hypothetical protein